MSHSEFELIRKYFMPASPGPDSGILVGVGDDAAVLDVPADKQLCFSMDVLNEAVHFPKAADPFLLGQRALAVNLSDLAAMGAQPFCFSLGLSLPGIDELWLAEFSRGLLQLAEQHRCPLVGGDTTRGPLAIAIQVHGLVSAGAAICRSGAKAGDLICVTGTLGNGSLALAADGLAVHYDSSLQATMASASTELREFLRKHFYSPEPRLEFMQQASRHLSAAIDVSDGLAGDLGHILDASGVGAMVQLESLPFHPLTEAIDRQQLIQAALFGGDDYEICCTLPKRDFEAVADIAAQQDLQFTPIGEIVDGGGLRGQTAAGETLSIESASYQHFAAEQP